MAGKLSFLESLALKLSGIPGLRFLDSYVTDIRTTKTQIDQQVGDYQSYADAATSAASDVKGAATSTSEAEDDDDDDGD